MIKMLLLAGTALLLSAGAVLAQSARAAPTQAAQAPVLSGPVSEAPLVDAAQQGVLVFEPAFFADQRPNTVQDMLGRLPGFTLIDGDGSRGFEGAVGNVLFNGVRPASKNDTASSVAGRTSASQVERIELVRGGAPGIAMQGYSVVANVVLKRETSKQHIVNYNNTLFDGGPGLHGGSYTYTVRNGDKTWTAFLSDGVSMSDSNGPGRNVRIDGAGALFRDETFVNKTRGGGNSARGTYSGPFAGGRLEATARYGVGDFRYEQLLTSPTSERLSVDANESKSGEVGLTHTLPVLADTNLETRFIHTFTDTVGSNFARTTLNNVASPEQVFAFESLSSETILRGLLRHEASSALTIEGGAEAAYNMLDTEQQLTVGGGRVPLPSATVKVEEVRGEVFSQATWRARPTLTLEGGLRFEASTITQSGDASQEKSLYYLKPRFQATWTPTPGQQVRARFELDVGQLNFSDFAASADFGDDQLFGGNVDLEPEQRWISEVVYERRFWSNGIVSLGLRHDEIKDALDRIPLPGGLSARGNIGAAKQDRIDLNLVVPTDRLGIDGGRFAINGYWNKTEVRDPTTGQTRPISKVRPSEVRFNFDQDLPRFKSVWGVFFMPKFMDPTYDPDQRQIVTLRNYFQTYLEYKPRPDLSIRTQINFWNDFSIDRIAYANRTAARPIDFIEYRDIDPREFLQLRIRKTF